MKRSELEKYLGQKVEIKLSDGDILKGPCIRQAKNNSRITLTCTYLKNVIL